MGSNVSAARDIRAVLDAVRRIVHGLRESSRQAEKRVGLTAAQLFVLHKLAESPLISLNELAALTHTHQSSVSVVVARLETAGLVRRSWNDRDRRRLELSLTPKGSKAAAGAPDAAQERLIAGIERLAVKRRQMLADGLIELAAAVDSVTTAPAMFFEERPSRAARPRAAAVQRPQRPAAARRSR